jgi:8-oxo-dGTP pyrophosphatase MutT (NUDIX family)
MTSDTLVRAAGVVVAHRDAAELKLLLLRNRGRAEWGFPKGHCEPGEDDFAAAKRELAEETGIVQFDLVADFRFVSRYRLPARHSKPNEQPKTKQVVYFLATVASSDVVLSAEHDGAKWVGARECDDMLTFHELRTLARAAFARLKSGR